MKTAGYLSAASSAALMAGGLIVGGQFASVSHPETVWVWGGCTVAAAIWTPHRYRPATIGCVSVLAMAILVASGIAPALAFGLGIANAVQVSVALAIVMPTARESDVPGFFEAADIGRLISGVIWGGLVSLVPFSVGWSFADLQSFAPALLSFLLWSCVSLMCGIAVSSHFVDTPPPSERIEHITMVTATLIVVVLVALVDGLFPLASLLFPLMLWGSARVPIKLMVWLGALAVAASWVVALAQLPVARFADVAMNLQELWASVFVGFVTMTLLFAVLPVAIQVSHGLRAAEKSDEERMMLDDVLRSAATTAVIAVDEGARVTVFNTGAEALFGYSADEVVGTIPITFFFPEEVADIGHSEQELLEMLAHLADSSDQEPADWEVLGRDGQVRMASLKVARIRSKEGKLRGYLVTGHDVTNRAEAERAMQSALLNERTTLSHLLEVDRFKADFVATASHELRTPVTNIVGFTELLVDGEHQDLPPQTVTDYLQRISENGARMMQLIEDLSTSSAAETPEPEDSYESIDLRTVVSDAVRSSSAMAQRHENELTVDLPSALWVSADPAQMEQALGNLISNAIKFSKPRGQVRVTGGDTGYSVWLKIQDEGFGMSAAETEQVFTPFFRGEHATQLQIQGAGLGMGLAQGIIRAHGGEIILESELGVGTVCQVHLPRTEPQVPAPRQPPAD